MRQKKLSIAGRHHWQRLLVGERGDAGEGFAFEELERGAAAGGDVGDAVGDAGLLDCGDGVAAADDGGGVCVGGDGFGDGLGARGEGGHLKDAHGAVPEDGVGAGDFVGEEVDGFGADVEGHKSAGKGPLPLKIWVLASAANLSARTWSMGSRKLTPLASGFGERVFGDVDLVGFEEGLADILARALRKV